MNKLIATVAFGLLSAGTLLAEDYPIDLMIRDMGYEDPIITVDVANQVKKSNKDAEAYYKTKKLDDVKKSRKVKFTTKRISLDKEDVLRPRISDACESPEMIPALLRYHKENPKSAKITKKLAVTTYELGQFKESLYWYTLTYQRDRKDLESLWNMATIAESIGDKQQSQLYLKEYAKVDPNSAWGRMARNILNSGYQADNMSESFDDHLARILGGDSLSSSEQRNENRVDSSDDNASSENHGLIVVSDERHDGLEAFVSKYKQKKNFNTKEMKADETLKGKIQEADVAPKVEAKKEMKAETKAENKVNHQTSLGAAKIAEKAAPVATKKPTEKPVANSSVTAVAEPL